MSWDSPFGPDPRDPVPAVLITSRLNYLAEILRYHVGLTDDASRRELAKIAVALEEEGSLIGETLVKTIGTGSQRQIDVKLCELVDELRAIQRGFEERPQEWNGRGRRQDVLRWISESWWKRER